jgi:hypothetical protein
MQHGFMTGAVYLKNSTVAECAARARCAEEVAAIIPD